MGKRSLQIILVPKKEGVGDVRRKMKMEMVNTYSYVRITKQITHKHSSIKKKMLHDWCEFKISMGIDFKTNPRNEILWNNRKPCIRLAREKFKLTNQASAGGKNSSVLILM